MGIRVKHHESLTLAIGDADLTVPTHELFKAWMDKHIFQQSAAPSGILIPKPRDGEKHLCSIITPDLRICHSILLPDRADKNWNDGMEWAKNLGGDLLDRAEQAVGYRDMPDEFDKTAHWSNTQHAGHSNYAWYQHFDDGDQVNNCKSAVLAVRCVRREFSNLAI